ncbi:NADP-dependent oxidoreductase [Microbacterium sp. A8/3-1]|uniref:NADP-dependent oxidoreductase n=1 Tax=Microbacterium sp. A8/3-1 TaxID=3160749 RepID=A0AAU7W1G1_9MICO
MRAAIVTNPGGPEAIELVDLADPVPGKGEVLLTLQAAGVNPVDAQTRSGIYHKLGWVSATSVGLGWDAVGVVVARGPGVSTLVVGQRVAALIGGVDRAYGPYAERMVIAADDCALIPASLSSDLAATIPLNATTAHQALALLGDPGGRRLLVTGAAGGVGGYAIELARGLGFAVTGLARAADADSVGRTGALFTDSLPGDTLFDAVLDAAAIGDEALASVRDGGDYVGVIPVAVPEPLRGIRTQAVMAAPDGELLKKLLDAAATGALTPRVHTLMPLSEVHEAHRLLDAGGFRGRIVLDPLR